MDKNLLASDEVPMGLSMALAKNLEAMNAFTALPPESRGHRENPQRPFQKGNGAAGKRPRPQRHHVKEEGKSPPLLYCSHVLTATYRVKHIQFS